MRLFYSCLLSLLLFGNTFSQSPGNVPGNKIWLKAENPNNSITRKKLNQDDIIKSYFNFNPITDRQSYSKTFRNIVSEQYSLFIVFKSDFEDERIIMNVNRGKTNVLITNKEVLNNTEMPFKLDSKNGIILSYLNGNNDKNGKKRNSLILDDLFGQDEEGKERLMELIYFPRILSKIEKEKVETYLSIKYGISISGNFDYRNSKGDKIWDAKESSSFANNITGVGRDDAYELYQKQSGNSNKDGLYIGLGKIDTTNAHNKYTLKDKSFLLWGDNGAKTLLALDKDYGLKKMSRIWKMNVTGILPADSITTQIKINKKEFGYVNNNPGKDYLWLSLNANSTGAFDYTGSKFIRQSAEDNDFIYFNDITWDTDGNGSDTFTFIQGPNFMMEHSEDFICESENGSTTIKLIGGTAPFTLNLNGKEIISQKDIIEYDDLQSGIFNLKVSDSKGNSLSDKIEINSIPEAIVSLAPVWRLNTQEELVIKPMIDTTSSPLSFEWLSKGKRISTEKELTTKAPGDYTLLVSNNEGCKKSIPFRVEGNTAASGWIVYPNPVLSGEQFSIEFNLEKESQVAITISSMEGKQILYKNLGLVKDFSFKETMIISGVYLIKIQIGNTTDTVKLIVH